jgi:hypothetical protein
VIENEETRPLTPDRVDISPEQERPGLPVWSWGIFACLIAYVACFTLMVAPLQRRIGTPLMASLSISKFFVLLGAWLPANLHWLPDTHDSYISTNNLEFLFLVALAFVLYGLTMLLTLRLPAQANYVRIRGLTWIVVTLVGLLLIFTPALLSHDLFVYADYGHTLITYHANLYFIPPASVPHTSHDAITLLDDWRSSIAAYGPLWLVFSALVAVFGGDHPLRYIVEFRALGLFAHVVNAWLILHILCASGRSPRTATLGMLLYVLNPLALIESALGAHNDVVMITFILLGILLAQRGMQCGMSRFLDYAPPAIAFTLAVLIKFTSLPLIAFYLVLLLRTSLQSSAGQPARRSWLPALLKTCIAGLICAATALLFYAPFWVGHSLKAILLSFSSPPSSRLAENSILRASEGWVAKYGLPPGSSWTHTFLLLLTNHATWNALNLLVVALATLIGVMLIWRTPAASTLTLAALITLGALLLVTPWFFAWYVTWLIALAAALLSSHHNAHLRIALTAFALAFTVFAFFTYLNNGQPIFGKEGFIQCLRIFGLPLLVFLLAWLIAKGWKRRVRKYTPE